MEGCSLEGIDPLLVGVLYMLDPSFLVEHPALHLRESQLLCSSGRKRGGVLGGSVC